MRRARRLLRAGQYHTARAASPSRHDATPSSTAVGAGTPAIDPHLVDGIYTPDLHVARARSPLSDASTPSVQSLHGPTPVPRMVGNGSSGGEDRHRMRLRGADRHASSRLRSRRDLGDGASSHSAAPSVAAVSPAQRNDGRQGAARGRQPAHTTPRVAVDAVDAVDAVAVPGSSDIMGGHREDDIGAPRTFDQDTPRDHSRNGGANGDGGGDQTRAATPASAARAIDTSPIRSPTTEARHVPSPALSIGRSAYPHSSKPSPRRDHSPIRTPTSAAAAAAAAAAASLSPSASASMASPASSLRRRAVEPVDDGVIPSSDRPQQARSAGRHSADHVDEELDASRAGASAGTGAGGTSYMHTPPVSHTSAGRHDAAAYSSGFDLPPPRRGRTGPRLLFRNTGRTGGGGGGGGASLPFARYHPRGWQPQPTFGGRGVGDVTGAGAGAGRGSMAGSGRVDGSADAATTAPTAQEDMPNTAAPAPAPAPSRNGQGSMHAAADIAASISAQLAGLGRSGSIPPAALSAAIAAAAAAAAQTVSRSQHPSPKRGRGHGDDINDDVAAPLSTPLPSSFDEDGDVPGVPSPDPRVETGTLPSSAAREGGAGTAGATAHATPLGGDDEIDTARRLVRELTVVGVRNTRQWRGDANGGIAPPFRSREHACAL